MNLFFLPADSVSGNTGELPEDEARHALQVLRFKEGDEIWCTDGKGTAYKGIVSSTGKKKLQIAISETVTESVPNASVTVALGYIRQKQRLEFAIEKLVELGVEHIAIFHGDHSEPGKVKSERAQSIIKAASKQSMRFRFPAFSSYKSLDELLTHLKPKNLVAAHEKVNESKEGVGYDQKRAITGVVGPEGGLSDREIEVISERGGELVSLGKRRLRAETAAIVLAAQLIC